MALKITYTDDVAGEARALTDAIEWLADVHPLAIRDAAQLCADRSWPECEPWLAFAGLEGRPAYAFWRWAWGMSASRGYAADDRATQCMSEFDKRA